MSKFIQPVSMRVTEEQYERDLREPLLAMGYTEIVISDFDLSPILTNNYDNNMGEVSNTDEFSLKEHNRHFIPKYNPEYFLAVAAMTNEEFGIIGEWWKCVEDDTYHFTNGILYKCVEKYNNILPTYRCNVLTKQGYIESAWHFRYFTKATLQDIINHFEHKTNKNIKNMELTQQEKETLSKLVTKDNEAIFEKLGIKRDKNPIGVLQNDSHAKEEIAKYIVAAEMTPSIIGKKELTSRAFAMCPNYGSFYKFVLHEKNGLQVLAIEEK